MVKIYHCPQSLQSSDHLGETLTILAAAPTEISKMVSSVTMLVAIGLLQNHNFWKPLHIAFNRNLPWMVDPSAP